MRITLLFFLIPLTFLGQNILNEEYKNGVYPEGELIDYWSNGFVKFNVTILDKNLHGPYVFYFKNGQVEDTMYFDHGVLSGEALQFDKDGNLLCKEVYNKDTLISRHDFFYKKGRLVEEQYVEINKASRQIPEYKMIKSKSRSVSYSPEKTMEALPSFGYLVQYHKNGKVKAKEPRINSKGNGKCYTYFKDGGKASEYFLKDGLKHGEEIIYKKDGSVIKTIQWALGKKK